jgi:UDP-N-acetylmuramoylalanine-D-glutamate ligase
MKYKKLAILGYGVTGQALLNYFFKHIDNIDRIDIFDGRQQSDFDVEDVFVNHAKINFHFGSDIIPKIEEYEILLISPSTPENHPSIVAARKNNLEVHNDVSYFISKWHN